MADPILEGLIKTRNQIARPGFFHKKQYYNNFDDEILDRKKYDLPCCIFGAVGFATNVHPASFAVGSLGRKIIELLEQHVPNFFVGLIHFNDYENTTQDDMIALCDRTIKARRISR